MSATILALPRRSPIQALCRASDDSAPFTPAWCEQHLPLIEAAVDLLEADEAEFSQRCALMRDEDGRAMFDELAGQLRRFEAHLAHIADALSLISERIRCVMLARLLGWVSRGRCSATGATLFQKS